MHHIKIVPQFEKLLVCRSIAVKNVWFSCFNLTWINLTVSWLCKINEKSVLIQKLNFKLYLQSGDDTRRKFCWVQSDEQNFRKEEMIQGKEIQWNSLDYSQTADLKNIQLLECFFNFHKILFLRLQTSQTPCPPSGRTTSVDIST